MAAVWMPGWQALVVTIQQAASPPPDPPSLAPAVRWIAQLGGFLGRAGDGDPGPRTIWRGPRRLDDLATLWVLTHTGAVRTLAQDWARVAA